MAVDIAKKTAEQDSHQARYGYKNHSGTLNSSAKEKSLHSLAVEVSRFGERAPLPEHAGCVLQQPVHVDVFVMLSSDEQYTDSSTAQLEHSFHAMLKSVSKQSCQRPSWNVPIPEPSLCHYPSQSRYSIPFFTFCLLNHHLSPTLPTPTHIIPRQQTPIPHPQNGLSSSWNNTPDPTRLPHCPTICNAAKPVPFPSFVPSLFTCQVMIPATQLNNPLVIGKTARYLPHSPIPLFSAVARIRKPRAAEMEWKMSGVLRVRYLSLRWAVRRIASTARR